MLVDFDLSTVFIGLILFIIILLVLKYKYKKRSIFFVFMFIMFVYFLAVAKFTLFPFPLFSSMSGPNLMKNINLIPFKNGFGIQDFYNIIMTIPFGFGMPFLWKVTSLKKTMIAALLSGTTIEIMQFLLALVSEGFTFRTIDINDVICNFVGTWVGFILLILFSIIYIKLIRNLTKLNLFWKSVYDVCESVMNITDIRIS